LSSIGVEKNQLIVASKSIVAFKSIGIWA